MSKETEKDEVIEKHIGTRPHLPEPPKPEPPKEDE